MQKYNKSNQFCNNCGKQGHVFNQCKLPTTSIGIVAFKKFEKINKYLMICRKDSLGFIEFLRGKYPLYNKNYIQSLINELVTTIFINEDLDQNVEFFINEDAKGNLLDSSMELFSIKDRNELRSHIVSLVSGMTIDLPHSQTANNSTPVNNNRNRVKTEIPAFIKHNDEKVSVLKKVFAAFLGSLYFYPSSRQCVRRWCKES